MPVLAPMDTGDDPPAPVVPPVPAAVLPVMETGLRVVPPVVAPAAPVAAPAPAVVKLSNSVSLGTDPVAAAHDKMQHKLNAVNADYVMVLFLLSRSAWTDSSASLTVAAASVRAVWTEVSEAFSASEQVTVAELTSTATTATLGLAGFWSIRVISRVTEVTTAAQLLAPCLASVWPDRDPVREATCP